MVEPRQRIDQWMAPSRVGTFGQRLNLRDRERSRDGAATIIEDGVTFPSHTGYGPARAGIYKKIFFFICFPIPIAIVLNVGPTTR